MMAYLVVLGLLLIGFVSADSECIVDDFPVQQDFDIGKFAGRWYEISWVPYYFEPPFDNFFDFVTNYTIWNETFVVANTAGRVNTSDKDCITAVDVHEVSDNPAKWTVNFTKLGVDYSVDYWIMDTDYSNYAFAYGCAIKADDGTCRYAHAWKWSRRQTLQDNYMQILDEAVTSYCMTNYTFHVSPHSADCFAATDTSDGNAVLALVPMVIACVISGLSN